MWVLIKPIMMSSHLQYENMLIKSIEHENTLISATIAWLVMASCHDVLTTQ
jgi:hypothetical protein